MENKRKNILLLVVSAILILIIGVFFALWDPTPPPLVKMPLPNGYTDLAQAGTMVQKQSGAYEIMNIWNLEALVAANSNALQTARSGLAKKSRVPLEPSQNYATKHMAELQHSRMLAFAFFAEGRLAELNQRTNDAAQSYGDAARLGISLRQGGPLIDNLYGIHNEAMGVARLQKLVPNLNAGNAAKLAHELEDAESGEESWEQILQNEKNWMRAIYPGPQRRIMELISSFKQKASLTKSKQHYEDYENETRRLMLDLAAHAYQLDKGRRPTNASDLVPAYLKATPIDPLTGKEMTLTP